MRILLSEGSSTSAREAVTALGLAGHRVEVCDPDPRCFARLFAAKVSLDLPAVAKSLQTGAAAR